MRQDKVSIIIPVYNTEKYLERCILSVENQTYTNIEIIIVDDASPDNSAQVYEKLQKQYSNIAVVKHATNQKQVASRNSGLLVATGEWILFLDSDDILYPTAIEQLVAQGKKDNTSIVLATYTKNINDHRHIVFSGRLPTGKYPLPKFLAQLFNCVPLDVVSCIGTKLYKLSFLREHSICFRQESKYNEDLMIVLDVLSHTEEISYLDEAVYEYDIRQQGSTQSSYRPNLFSYLYITRMRLEDLLKKYGVWEQKRPFLDDMWLNIITISLLQEMQYFGKLEPAYQEVMEKTDVLARVKSLKCDSWKQEVFKWVLLSKCKMCMALLIRAWLLMHKIKKGF